MTLRRFGVLLLTLTLLANIPGPILAQAQFQTTTAEQLLEKMSPEEKVGQLFLVTFEGTDIKEDSPLYNLITTLHVGGFVLRADDNNFVENDTISAAYDLISEMQTTAWKKAQIVPNTEISRKLPVYIPLYIGIDQPGGGGKSEQFLDGLTPLPNQMAMGATWSPGLAQDVGTVVGSELAALGFNLFLGPTLDVIDTSILESASFSGTETFGEDPYWVGELGKAYVTGVHDGSDGKICVIAKHFPGLGGADRPPTEEVATVRKSLEQLKQIELAPYFAVTGSDESSSRVDGLMISHVRFQGFQGNIRATTKPVSFDAAALEQLLAVEPLATWRDSGGLTVSDSLGSRAVRLLFDSTGTNFDAVNVARTAFLAGNDMLYLDEFIANGDASAYQTIQRTLSFFSQKYQEDSAFAQRVDTSVLRILRAKLDLYGEFSLERVTPEKSGLNLVGKANEVNFNTAREAVTLISPGSDYLATLLPNPPSTYEYMIIFSDQRTVTQCGECLPQYKLQIRDFQDSLLSLYGPSGSNQILQNRINSYSFAHLTELLDRKVELTDPYLADNLKRASWVIFNIQDLDSELSDSYALRRILSERMDLLKDKRVIVFAYNAPYYLDATEISKVTAYYSLYDTNKGFVDVAARVLMQEIQPNGSLPVSLAAVGYDLIVQTSPDPDQVIPISLIAEKSPISTAPALTETQSAEETPVPLFNMGETVKIRAGIIRDHNQHLVPDGTVVQFTIRLAGDDVIIAQPQATTIGGIAAVEYRIERDGIFEVTASSEPATTSGILVLNTQGGLAQLIMPTPTATSSPTPTLIPTLLAESTLSPESTVSRETSGFPDMQEWLLTLMVLTIGFSLAFIAGRYWWGSVIWGIRAGLCSLIGGFATYLLLTFGIASLEQFVIDGGTVFVVQIAIIGMFLGFLGALIWWMISSNPSSKPTNPS